VRRTLEDTYELTRLLRQRFGQSRIYLVGHSWGSYLGMLAAREHPEYYLAYVGMGQLAADTGEAHGLQRQWLQNLAGAADDTATVRRLARGGAVSEDDLFRYGGELHTERSFWPILWTGLRAPEYTLGDVWNVKRGADFVNARMRDDVGAGPLEREVTRLEIPVFFLLGRHDFNTPSALAERYLRKLHAPLKSLVWFEESAHFPFLEEPARFHGALREVDRETRAFWAAHPAGAAGAASPPAAPAHD
jgi:pimeloyl-ACP methyl ester carboxylesterase